MHRGYIKLMRSSVVMELIAYQPKAFLLLTIIACRARRSGEKCRFTGLESGQAMLGDYKACGLTHQEYRTAKQQLQANNLATFKTTNKGTIATLCNTDVYDINCEQDNNQNNSESTSQQQTNNKQITTNKNDKNDNNEKNEKKNIYTDDFLKFWNIYKTGSKASAFYAWRKQKPSAEELSEILSSVPVYKAYCEKCDRHLKDGQGWINGRFWETDWKEQLRKIIDASSERGL